MLGNDVVDLLDPESAPESFRPRFDRRVYSPEERRAITRDRDPLARRWAHWAAKEAAYKLAKQVDDAVIFSPSNLVARFEPASDVSKGSGFDYVRRGRLDWPRALAWGVRAIELRSFETHERVHVIALPEGCDWAAVDSGIAEIDPGREDPSVAVRALATREVARRLGVREQRITIGRRDRIPTLELDGEPTALSLSLSHHGRWVGYAIAPRVDVELEAHDDGAWKSSRSGRLTAE